MWDVWIAGQPDDYNLSVKNPEIASHPSQKYSLVDLLQTMVRMMSSLVLRR